MKVSNHSRDNRSAFTLIELLTIIAIIAVLAGLTAFAVFRTRASGEVRDAETRIEKLASIMDQQLKALNDAIRDKRIPEPLLSMCGGNNVRARVLYQKIALRAELPENVADFTDIRTRLSATTWGNELIPPSYVQALPSSFPNQETENAFFLYLFLSKGRRGMAAFNPEEAVGPGAVQDVTSGSPPRTYKIFVDGWQKPIRFKRWDANNTELQTSEYVKNPMNPDPLDPEGIFNSTTSAVWGSNLGTVSGLLGVPTYHPTIGNLTNARNLTPYIISSGPNKAYDILTTPTDSKDDILSYRLRKSGQRGS